MESAPLTIARQLAAVLSGLQQPRTGHVPKAVSVVLSEDTLVVTMHDALTPAEKDLARTPDSAARVQDFHRQLFANSVDEMRKEIRRITGRLVREAAAEVETATGTVVHAFTTGAMVQVFLLTLETLPGAGVVSKQSARPDAERRVSFKGFVQDIENLADKNEDVRRVLYTAKNGQLVLKSLKPKEQIGAEVILSPTLNYLRSIATSTQKGNHHGDEKSRSLDRSQASHDCPAFRCRTRCQKGCL